MKVNKEVYLYIKQEKKAGTGDAVIEKALKDVGWDNKVVKNAFKYYENKKKEYIKKKKTVKKKSPPKKVETNYEPTGKKSTIFVWFMLILFFFIIIGLGGGYIYFRYKYVPDEAEDYYKKNDEGLQDINAKLEILEKSIDIIDLEIDGVEEINFNDSKYRGEVETFDYSAKKSELGQAIKEIRDLEDDVDEYMDDLVIPEYCDTPLKYVETDLCNYHDDVEEYLSDIEDRTIEIQSNLEYYDDILLIIKEYEVFADKSSALKSEDADELIETLEDIKSKIGKKQSTSELKPFKDGLTSVMKGMEEYIEERDSSKDEVTKISEDTQKEYKDKLEEAMSNIEDIKENIEQLTEDKDDLEEDLEKLLDKYEIKKKDNDEDTQEDEDNSDDEKDHNDEKSWLDNYKTEIDGTINENEVQIIYGKVTKEEADMFTNGDYYEWTFSTEQPKKSCGTIDQHGVIVRTKVVEEGEYAQADPKGSVMYTKKGGASQELNDGFQTKYYYEDPEEGYRSISVDWKGKFVIEKIDTQNQRIEGYLEFDYQPFVFGGEERAKAASAKGKFIVEYCVVTEK